MTARFITKSNRVSRLLVSLSIALLLILIQGYYHAEIVDAEVNNTNTTSGALKTIIGKKVVAFGDSIMEGVGNDNFGIADILGKKYKMEVYDYSKGGSTVGWYKEFSKLTTNAGKRKNIQYQLDCAAMNLNITPDYVLIDGGTNDIRRNISLGSISKNKTYNKNTFTGGLEYCFNRIQKMYPNAKIIYIRSHNMGSRTTKLQIKYGERAKVICAKWGVKFVDIYNESPFNTNLTEYNKYTWVTDEYPKGDMTHPTQVGYDNFYIPYIEKAITDLINIDAKKQNALNLVEKSISKN